MDRSNARDIRTRDSQARDTQTRDTQTQDTQARDTRARENPTRDVEALDAQARDTRASARRPPSRWSLALDAFARIVVAAGLAIDAYVHADLAGTYAESGGTINEGVLFRAEAVLASLAALVVLLTGRRLAYVFAFVVAASALTLMLVARYVQLAPFGPFPDLSDPVWFPEKLWAAYAEGAAALAAAFGALGGLLLNTMPSRRVRVTVRK